MPIGRGFQRLRGLALVVLIHLAADAAADEPAQRRAADRGDCFPLPPPIWCPRTPPRTAPDTMPTSSFEGLDSHAPSKSAASEAEMRYFQDMICSMQAAAPRLRRGRCEAPLLRKLGDLEALERNAAHQALRVEDVAIDITLAGGRRDVRAGAGVEHDDIRIDADLEALAGSSGVPPPRRS